MNSGYQEANLESDSEPALPSSGPCVGIAPTQDPLLNHTAQQDVHEVPEMIRIGVDRESKSSKKSAGWQTGAR
jgi:hypothetical protein